MAIGGWTDGYTDAVLRLLAHARRAAPRADRPLGPQRPGARRARAGRRLARRVRALLRPLAQGRPKRARRGADAGRLAAGQRAAARPPRGAPRPLGRRGELAACRAARAAPSPDRPATGLRACPGERAVRELRGAQTTGMDGGAWCADGHSDDLPLDQRADDGRSLCFDSPPLDEPLEILGHAQADLDAGQRPPAGARQRAPVRAAPGRRVAARDARPAQPDAPGRPRPRRAARAGRARRGARPARRDRAPLLGRLAPARRDLAHLLAARLALARGRHARRGDRRRARSRCRATTTRPRRPRPRCARPRSRRTTR